MVSDGYKIYQDDHLVSCIKSNHWVIHLKTNIILALAGVAQWIEHGLWTKGLLFHSQSGHVSGLQARSPAGGVREATTHGCFFPLSPSLPLSLKINEWMTSSDKLQCDRISDRHVCRVLGSPEVRHDQKDRKRANRVSCQKCRVLQKVWMELKCCGECD